MNDLQFILLTLLSKKNMVESSYSIGQLFTIIGIFDSVHDNIIELQSKGYLITQGYFDDNSKLIKNITITPQGRIVVKEISKNRKEKLLSTYNSELLREVLL